MNNLQDLMNNGIIATLITAMVPVLELRAAIPLGVTMGLSHMGSLIVSVVGNMIPIPFIILFIRRVFDWMKVKIPKLRNLVERLEKRAEEKRKIVERFKFWGLVFFVAIPLPGTGAWTGALVAALMNMRMKNALPAIALGVVIAGLIVSIVTYGVVGLFS